MTGQYDRKAEGQALTDANTARLARDPFAHIPGAEIQTPGNQASYTPSQVSIDGTITPTPDGNPNLEGVKHTPPDAPAYGIEDVTETPAAVERADAAAVRAEAPDVCGADTATGQCQRRPHAPEYPHVSGKYAAAADADLPNPDPGAVDLFRADWPYPVLSAADFTGLYRQAAELIKARGYYPHEASGYADEPGISITGALKMAAHAYVKALGPNDTTDQHYRAIADITEELETRLSAVLYVLGQVHTRTGISDLSDIHVGWSLAHFDIGPNPSLAAAVSLLEQAARMFAALENVTEAPDPGRM